MTCTRVSQPDRYLCDNWLLGLQRGTDASMSHPLRSSSRHYLGIVELHNTRLHDVEARETVSAATLHGETSPVLCSQADARSVSARERFSNNTGADIGRVRNPTGVSCGTR